MTQHNIFVSPKDRSFAAIPPNVESVGMDEEQAKTIWSLFEELAPNICYINRLRQLVAGLVDEASDVADLLGRLQGAMPEIGNPSLRTDMKILKEGLERMYRTELEG